MSKRECISRYSLIIKKLRKHPSNFKEISAYLALESEIESYNFSVSKRTFQRDLEDIRSLYNIDIQYDFSRKVYFIDLDDQPEVNVRILEAFETFNALNISDRLSNHIHFENRRPAGTENLYGLLHAIKNRLQIKFTYHKFWDEDSSERIAEPYALKEFNSRWYILAKERNGDIVKSFGLDRLTNLEITRTTFKFPNEYNIEESYRYCFGIISPNGEEPQEIILSFDPVQGKYIKSLPLHTTQQILVDNAKELQIKLTLFVTYDLIKELLSYGEYVKVIQPASLIDEIRKTHKRAYKQY
ncbi:MAG TPA: WYL domain-containing protein [Prolixibacteraceae bacterium]|nr:WYL domain-containing protein [Prolixibacteraceae bacterium]